GLKIDPTAIKSVEQIPFLPIRFFKSHEIKTTDFIQEVVFESSGTTQSINSRHFVKEKGLYEKSLMDGFENVYGSVKKWCIIGLLPSYLERENSSLVYMVDKLVKHSEHPRSGFYLYEEAELAKKLAELEKNKQKTLLIGVTYALLDFAKNYALELKNTTILETGGMKGRKREMIREEVHRELMNAFGLDDIHAEYGMTELLSQAYSTGEGIYQTPAWMKVLVREEDDPLSVRTSGNGVLNVIDLANV